MRRMADILLSVGMQTGSAEHKEFLSQLQSIINSVNQSEDTKVKVGLKVDTAGLEKFKNQLSKILSEASDTEKQSAMYSQLNNLLKSVSSEYEKQASAAQKAQSASERAAKQQLNQQKQQENSLKTLYNMLRQVEQLQTKVASGKGGTDSSSYKNLEGLKNEIQDIINKIDSFTPEQLAYKIATLGKNFASTRQEFNASGDAIRNLSGSMSRLESKVVYMLSLSNIIMQVVRQLKQMITTTIELDSAMTQLRVVTNNTEAEYASYGKAVAQTAQEIGASIKDLVDSTTVFARLGYSLEDSAGLAKYTAMLQNVGDIDVASAQSALTAITKAYNIGADEIEAVMDKMIVVGNNFPISVAEIAEGMNNAGSALAASGNSFEESIALLTAANTTIQNISKSSTGLRTITARIRKTKTELDDLGETVESAAYEEVVNNLTKHQVLLTDANGEYRTTYAILQDIAGVWKDLTSMEQAAIAEQLAGKIVVLPVRTEMCA